MRLCSRDLHWDSDQKVIGINHTMLVVIVLEPKISPEPQANYHEIEYTSMFIKKYLVIKGM